MIINLTTTGRPLRLGLLVKPDSDKSLLEALRLNTSLWGGVYNPIIPIYRANPKHWREPILRYPAKRRILGYIEAFDPDILVNCGVEVPEYIEKLGIKIVDKDEIWENFEEDDLRPKYAVGIFDLLNHLYKEHFRYVERNPVKLVSPKIPAENKSFWTAYLGAYDFKIRRAMSLNGYRKALDIKQVEIDPERLGDLIKRDTFFPRRIVQYGLDIVSRSAFRGENTLFFMDATKPNDVIDYWNLRALGRNVMPVPKQLITIAGFNNLVTDFIEQSKRVYKHNPQLVDHAVIIRSPESTMEEMKDYINGLGLKKEDGETIPVGLQHWYPRIWDDWARDKDAADPADLSFDKSDRTLDQMSSKVELPVVRPKFWDKVPLSSGPCIANEISFSVYTNGDSFAEVLPVSNDSNLLRAVSGDGYIRSRRRMRIGKNGLVRFVDFDKDIGWELPDSNTVFLSWMKDQGWKVKASSAGHSARELNRQLKGWIIGLCNEELVRLFGEMSSTADGYGEKSVKAVTGRFQKAFGNKQRLSKFLELGLFKLGLTVQCPNCTKHSWYSLKDLNDSLVCPKCLVGFEAVRHAVQGSNWAYRTTGPLSLPNFAEGAIATLITMDFFRDFKFGSLKKTSSFSFEGHKIDNKEQKLEGDLAFLWQETKYGQLSQGVLFGECKTFDVFTKVDFNRMTRLAKSMPGSIILFATLRKELKPFEIVELKKIAKQGRRRWKSDWPVNPVLILTGEELLSEFGPPDCWKDGEKLYRYGDGLLNLCDATQQKYLNLPSWKEDWQKDLEERRKRYLEKKQNSPET